LRPALRSIFPCVTSHSSDIIFSSLLRTVESPLPPRATSSPTVSVCCTSPSAVLSPVCICPRLGGFPFWPVNDVHSSLLLHPHTSYALPSSFLVFIYLAPPSQCTYNPPSRPAPLFAFSSLPFHPHPLLIFYRSRPLFHYFLHSG